MIYIFEDGRKVYNKKYLFPGELEQTVAVDYLPEIEEKPGYFGDWCADLSKKDIYVKYFKMDNYAETETMAE